MSIIASLIQSCMKKSLINKMIDAYIFISIPKLSKFDLIS